MDHQLFIDRLLETENLTDNLEDDDANLLLDWGVAQITGLIKDITDHEAAGEKINGLMHVMRALNSVAGNPAGASHETITDLLSRYRQSFGETIQITDDEYRSIAERVSNMQPGEAINFLTKWLQDNRL
jgi:hypothetical protein